MIHLAQTKKRRGFSLIEMIIGLVLLAVGLGAMAALSISLSNIMSRNQNYSAACNLAEQKVEELRNETYGAIIDGDDGGSINQAGGDDGAAIYSRSWTVDDDTPAANMKTVLVSVSWDQWGETRTYELKGVIAND